MAERVNKQMHEHDGDLNDDVKIMDWPAVMKTQKIAVYQQMNR
jgi:hypothetical protein